MRRNRKRRKLYKKGNRRFGRQRGLRRILRRVRGATRSISKRRQPGLVPDETWVKLKWTYYAVFNNTGTGNSNMINVFRGNSPFDPDQTGVGSQPLGYDQWSAFYSQTYTAASKISIDLWNTSANINGQLITVIPTETAYTNATIITNPISQQPYAITKGMLPVANGYGNRTKIRAYMTTNKMYGQRQTENDDQFQANTGANPAAQWFWNVVLESINGTINVCQSCGIIKLTYYTKFHKRINLAAS